MKKIFKFSNILILTLLLTAYSCSDDEEVIINLQNLEVTIDENPTVGQVIGSIQSDSASSLTYSVTSQTPPGALSIDTSTGELTVLDAALFDFEANPVITATVSAVEADNTATITINLNDLNEIGIQDLTMTLDENPAVGQVIGTVQTSGTGTIDFSLTTETPAGAMSIDANTGVLTVIDVTLFDFETNPVITAVVSSTGALNTGTVTINLNDLNEISVQDFNVTIDENPTVGQVLGTVQTTGTGSVDFSITSETPTGALAIDANTGELTVLDAALFDFETNPTITAVISSVGALNTGTITIDLNDLNEVGEFKFGGVIFWIDPASSNSEGLVVGLNEDNLSWGCSGTTTGATGTDFRTGETNTATILSAGCAAPWNAVVIITSSNWDGYNDWFLPSIVELNEMYLNKTIINISLTANSGTNLSDNFYWTSTEDNANNAYFQFFGNGLQTLNSKSNISRVRPVRSWTDF